MLLDGLVALWAFALMVIGGGVLVVLIVRGVQRGLYGSTRGWSRSNRLAAQIGTVLVILFVLAVLATHTIQIYSMQRDVERIARSIALAEERWGVTSRRFDAAEADIETIWERTRFNRNRHTQMLQALERAQIMTTP